MRSRAGFGLTILVTMIAIAGIIFAGSTSFFNNMMRRTQLRIDDTKAYYLAQAGVMRAIYNWRVSNATETSRRYSGIRTTLASTNMTYATETTAAADQGTQADYAYFNNTVGPAAWATVSTRLRLRSWSIMNIRTADGASTNDNIIVTGCKISWTPDNGTTLRTMALNGTTQVANGTYANGSTLAFTGSAASRTLAPAATWSGTTTYFEWNNAINPPSPIAVTVQWIFNDDSATRDSRTHAVIHWGTTTGGTVAQGGAAPTQRTFCIHSTGIVDQTQSGYFPVLRSVRATVSGTPATCEIIKWAEIDKNIP